MREAAFQTGVAFVGRPVERRADRRDLPVGGVRLQAAADAAVAARGRDSRIEHGYLPRSSREISVMASVGQVSAQAPHETQTESRKPSSRPAAMLALKPRPVAVSA